MFSFLQNTKLDDSEAYYQARRAYKLDPEQDFVKVKNRIGLQASAIYAQIYFANLNRYKRFRREIELHQDQQNALNRECDVIIVVPPRGSLPQDSIEQMLKQSMGLATSAGFTYVSQAQLNSDNVLTGARRLLKLVKEKKKLERKVILVSFSYASAFVRVMLEQSEVSDISAVKGWVNLGGLLFGTPLYNCSDKKSIFSRGAYARRTFSCEQKYFSGTPHFQGVKTIHFLGMKDNQSLTRNEMKHKERLRPWGPSDGVVPFAPYQKLQHTVVPLLDQGHMIDLSRFSLTFVRTLSSLVSTVPMSDKKMPKPRLDQSFI